MVLVSLLATGLPQRAMQKHFCQAEADERMSFKAVIFRGP
jgi:hypothetical protein